MKTFTLILTIILIFTTVMCVYGAVEAGNNKYYSPLYHLEQIIASFEELPSFEELDLYIHGEGFYVPIEEKWRFIPWGFDFPQQNPRYFVVMPNLFREQNWVGFEWLNEPLGVIVAFYIRANGVTYFATRWITAFFKNADVLFPTAGLVERG